MLSRLSRIIIPGIIFASPLGAIAGEIGVSNSYSHGFREGTGSTIINFVSNSQTSETAEYGAFKIEGSSFGEKEYAALGNGNDKDKGNGNGQQSPDFGYEDSALAVSWGVGSRTMTETTAVDGTTTDNYSFGSTNFSHSVSVFAR